MWDLPGPGLEPVSLALAGGFLTTAPPGKSDIIDFKAQISKEGIKTDNFPSLQSPIANIY